MVEVSIDGAHVEFTVRGIDKLWALTSSLRVPLASIRDVRADPEVARFRRRGLRLPGLHVPGVISAGSFRQDGRRIFWDVRDPAKVIVVDLAGAQYDALIIEVADPETTVRRLGAARGAQ
jgi:hypothetical protein